MISINIHVGFNIYLLQLHAHLCFDEFEPLNLHLLKRRRDASSSLQGSASSYASTNFEFWVSIFSVPACFHMRIPKPYLSVCPSVHLSVPREKKSPWIRQYQSYISNWYINGKVFTSTTAWKPKNLEKSSKFKFWLVTKSWNHLSFVNVSPTLVIDTSMETSSRVLLHGNPKIWKKIQKSSKFEFWLVLNSWNNLSFVNINRSLAIDTSI